VRINNLNQDRLVSSQYVEDLTQRERDILELLAGEGSNQEIADQLFLSLSTVKGYIRQIYQKLGVNSRSKAVQRAREVGLLAAVVAQPVSQPTPVQD